MNILNRCCIAVALIATSVFLACLSTSSVFAQEYSNELPIEYVEWLNADPARLGEVSALETFLAQRGVFNILPTWQLLTPDKEANCPTDAFMIPPRKLWSNVVPTLRFVRDKVVPTVGQVQIVSGYRSPQFNQCNGGAKQSAHMSFSAFDMIPVDQSNEVKYVFDKLCRLWKSTPAKTKFGLGAYFDPAAPNDNPKARFHVDTWGKRTWSDQSSYCLK
jgi:hypothetical protein